MQTGTKRFDWSMTPATGGFWDYSNERSRVKSNKKACSQKKQSICIVLWAAERVILQAAQESPFILSGLAYLISLLISLFSASIPPHLLIYQFSEHCWNAAKRSSSLNLRGTNRMQKRYRNNSKKYNSILAYTNNDTESVKLDLL